MDHPAELPGRGHPGLHAQFVLGHRPDPLATHYRVRARLESLGRPDGTEIAAVGLEDVEDHRQNTRHDYFRYVVKGSSGGLQGGWDGWKIWKGWPSGRNVG